MDDALRAFRNELLNSINYEVADNHKSESEALLDVYKEYLIDDGSFTDMEYCYFEGRGRKGKIVKFDGYHYEESDNTISICICTEINKINENPLLSDEVNRYFDKAEAIITERDYIIENGEPSTDGYDFAVSLKNKYNDVTKFKFYLLTDVEMPKSLKIYKRDKLPGIDAEYYIWDIRRIFNLDQAGKVREDLIIDLQQYSQYGVECLPASKTDTYSAYLCNMPGIILAELYLKFGSRLLEGNVRSFLQLKGKVNKGIRNTILNKPEMFFAYNNGIAATAEEIALSEINGRKYITTIKSLQIVNGGQTTASLATALNAYKIRNKRELGKLDSNVEENIRNIFVPMKLNVVSMENADELISSISRYANTQNKVSEADLASNHPFHIKIEKLSRELRAPAVNGQQYETFWYYERANGQYRQETFKMLESEKRKFEREHPKNQVFKKVDLAKYWNIRHLNPQIASKGGQKSFAKFAEVISEMWDKDSNQFNYLYFKDVVSMAILFNETDLIIRTRRWYKSYKANIIAYTLSLIFFKIESEYSGRVLDLNKIWRNQKISKPLVRQLEITSKIVYEFLIREDRLIENVTEWAKRDECWEQAKDLDPEFTQEFIDSLGYFEDIKSEKRQAKKESKMLSDIECVTAVFNYGKDNWMKLLEWNETNHILNSEDIKFINKAVNFEKKIPQDKECVKIIKILNDARDEGFPI